MNLWKEMGEQIDSCKAEYDKYHPKAHNPNFASKTCSRVVDRICIINNYCKGDKFCITEAKRVYPPYVVGNDEEYCLNLVKKL